MPYSPVAEIVGGYGLLRGPGSYLSLAGYSRGTVLPLAPGQVVAAPGAGYVDRRACNAATAARARGHANTRGTQYRVPNSAVPPTCLVPYIASPAGTIDRTLGRLGTYSTQMRAGVDRVLPGGKELRAWTVTRMRDGFAYGLGDDVKLESISYKKAQKTLASTPTKVVVKQLLSKKSGQPVEGTNWGWSGTTLWVDKGIRAIFDVTFGAQSDDLYGPAVSTLQSFIDKVKSGSIDPQSAIPASLASLPAPPSDASQVTKDAWARFQTLRDTNLPSARIIGAIYWEAAHPASTTPVTTTPVVTTPGTTTTPTTYPAGTVTTGADGRQYIMTSSGSWAPYSSPAAVAATPSGGSGTYVGGDPYSAGGETGATYVQAPPPVSSIVPTADGQGVETVASDGSTSIQPTGAPDKDAKPAGKAGLGIGILAIAGIAAFFYFRKRKAKAA